jgi:gas vesicle protein
LVNWGRRKEVDSGMNNTTGSGVGMFLMGLLVGAALGGVAALLMAPQPGAETRTMLKDRFGRMRDTIRSRGQRAVEEAEEAGMGG